VDPDASNKVVPCRACGRASGPHQPLRIHGAEAMLYGCPSCGLLFFPEPTWLAEAYADPIAEIDVGLPSRCVNSARVVEAIIRAERLGDRRQLDYGGGYGLMTRFARDRGLDMLHYDPFAKNLFAQGFEGSLDGAYGAISLIEVFEHLTDPVPVLQRLSAHAGLVVISTMLVPDGMQDLSDWWYLLPDLGQHISFYTEPALREIGAQAGYEISSNHRTVHVFHRDPLSALTRMVLRDIRISPAIGTVLRFRDRSGSLRDADGAATFERIAAGSRVAPDG
jgi:hypothetical protein